MPKELKIRVWYEPPPIPIRTWDWHAEVIGGDETKTGHGLTPREAVESLLDRVPTFEE